MIDSEQVKEYIGNEFKNEGQLGKVYSKMVQKFEQAYQNKVNSFLEEFVNDIFTIPLKARIAEIFY